MNKEPNDRTKIERCVGITWVSVEESLPPLHQIVLIYRFGGSNNHNDVGLGYRQTKYGNKDEWEWITTGETDTYWGKSVDGSVIEFWSEKPQPPVIPNEEIT